MLSGHRLCLRITSLSRPLDTTKARLPQWISVRPSSSGARWKQRQGSDPYAREAKVQGLKSRAAFKLLEVSLTRAIYCLVACVRVNNGSVDGCQIQPLQKGADGSRSSEPPLLHATCYSWPWSLANLSPPRDMPQEAGRRCVMPSDQALSVTQFDSLVGCHGANKAARPRYWHRSNPRPTTSRRCHVPRRLPLACCAGSRQKLHHQFSQTSASTAVATALLR